jgi:hypothetical protein
MRNFKNFTNLSQLKLIWYLKLLDFNWFLFEVLHFSLLYSESITKRNIVKKKYLFKLVSIQCLFRNILTRKISFQKKFYFKVLFSKLFSFNCIFTRNNTESMLATNSSFSSIDRLLPLPAANPESVWENDDEGLPPLTTSSTSSSSIKSSSFSTSFCCSAYCENVFKISFLISLCFISFIKYQ